MATSLHMVANEPKEAHEDKWNTTHPADLGRSRATSYLSRTNHTTSSGHSVTLPSMSFVQGCKY